MATPGLEGAVSDLPTGVYYRCNINVLINQIKQCDSEECARKNVPVVKERFLVSNEAEKQMLREEVIPLLEQRLAGTVDVAGLINFGDRYMEAGEPRQAFNYFTRAAAISPLNARALSGLAIAYAKLFEQDLPGAEISDKSVVDKLKKDYYFPALENIFFAMELEPSDDSKLSKHFGEEGLPASKFREIKTMFWQAWISKGWLLMDTPALSAELYRTLTNYSLLLCFDQAIAIYPDWAAGWYGKGYALHHRLSDNTENAKLHYQKALQLNNKYDEALGELASLLNSSGQRREALMHINKALEINPDREYYWNIKLSILNDLGASTEEKSVFIAKRESHFSKTH